MTRPLLLSTLMLLLTACTGIPETVKPVSGFDVERYLGTWYEIARLDHSFERGLERVTAEYTRRGDGGIKVINRGFKTSSNEWKQAEGKAYFIGEPSIGRLKVSFFGPFYGGYNVIALDPDYRFAMVCGPDMSYLWILARTPTLSADIKQSLIGQAHAAGFATEKLIFVSH